MHFHQSGFGRFRETIMSDPVSRSYTCSWCGTQPDPGALSCSACGADIDIQRAVTHSGWTKLPPRKDMAKIQFGSSHCQIEGAFVPVADMNLSAADTVYFAHHVLLWKDSSVEVDVMPMKGGFKRLMAGLPLIMTQAQGPGHIAFSRDAPGEIIALPIQPNHEIDVREHLFMVATGSVKYDFFDPRVWFVTGTGDDKETHYPLGWLMDRFRADDKPGLLLLHAAGNVFVRELGARESILIKPSALIFKDPTVSMQLHFEYPHAKYSMWGSWGNQYLWLRVQGPGRVAVSSVFEPTDGEERIIRDNSPATTYQW
jgi:uncharacterized protein (AIM24 family)